MIKTEMVVLDPPPTLSSYRDLLERNVTPIWTTEMADQRFFEHASPGTDERLIWNRALEQGINRSRLSLVNFTKSVVRAIPERRRESAIRWSHQQPLLERPDQQLVCPFPSTRLGGRCLQLRQSGPTSAADGPLLPRDSSPGTIDAQSPAPLGDGSLRGVTPAGADGRQAEATGS